MAGGESLALNVAGELNSNFIIVFNDEPDVHLAENHGGMYEFAGLRRNGAAE